MESAEVKSSKANDSKPENNTKADITEKRIKRGLRRATHLLRGLQVVACGAAVVGILMAQAAIIPQYPLFPVAGLIATAMTATIKLLETRSYEGKAALIPAMQNCMER